MMWSLNVDKVLIYMALNKITRDKFYKQCKIGRRTLQKILSGQTDIYLSDLLKVAKYIGCEITELII